MVTFGIAQISRFTAVYLIPIFTFLAIGFYSSTIFRLVQSRRYSVILSSIRQFCMYCFLYLLTAILIINLGFSFEKTFVRLGDYQFESKALKSLQSSPSGLKEMPVPVPYAYLWGLDMGKNKDETGYGSAPSYLMGKLGLENGRLKGFKEYFAITFLYKVPIATQLFLLMALVRLIHRRHQTNFWRNEAFLLIPPLFYFMSFSFSTAQLGIRYILMTFPYIFVFSSQVVLGWTALKKRSQVFIISLIVYLVISNLSYFPHYLSYFNELLIDRKMSYTILADSNLDWGQNKNYLKQYLEKNSDAAYLKFDKKGKLKFFNGKGEINAQKLNPGLIVVEANQLVGIAADPENFRWLRENKKPVGHIAYSYLIFEIEPQDLARLSSNLNNI